MIEKIKGYYTLSCDCCGDEADEEFFEFDDAVKYKKSNGWRSVKKNGEWVELCPSCMKLEA